MMSLVQAQQGEPTTKDQGKSLGLLLFTFLHGAEPRQICEANSVKVCGVKINDIEKLYRKPMVQSPAEHAASFLPEVTTL